SWRCSVHAGRRACSLPAMLGQQMYTGCGSLTDAHDMADALGQQGEGHVKSIEAIAFAGSKVRHRAAGKELHRLAGGQGITRNHGDDVLMGMRLKGDDVDLVDAMT